MKTSFLSEKDFNREVLSAKEKVVVDFFSLTCAPCKAMEPVLEELASEHSIKIYKINVKENRDLAKKYMIISVPTLLLFLEGEVLDFSVGYKTKEELTKFIQQ